jgi:O-antigen/teichoic acid export membrane protein
MASPDFTTRALVRGGGVVGTASMLDALVTVAISTVVARNLGASAFGSYAFAVASVGFLTIVGQMGVGPLLVRELAARSNRGSPTVAAALVVALSSGLLGLGFVVLGNAGFVALPPGIDSVGIGLVAVLVISSSLQVAIAEVFRGLQRLGHASVIGLPMYRLLHLTLILVVPLESTERTPVRYLGLATIASIVSLLAGVGALIIRRQELEWRRPQPLLVRALAIGGLPITTTKAADDAAGRLPIWVLASLDQVEAAGVYALAATMAKSLLLVQSVGWQTLSPFFARSWIESGATAWLERRVRGVASAATVLAAVVGVLVLVGMQLVLPSLVGEEYASAVPTALVLAVGTVISIAAGQCGMVLNLTGNQRSAAVAAVTGLAAAAVLVPLGSVAAGAAGAAAGTSAGMVTTNVLQARMASRKTGIHTPASIAILGRLIRLLYERR